MTSLTHSIRAAAVWVTLASALMGSKEALAQETGFVGIVAQEEYAGALPPTRDGMPPLVRDGYRFIDSLCRVTDTYDSLYGSVKHATTDLHRLAARLSAVRSYDPELLAEYLDAYSTDYKLSPRIIFRQLEIGVIGKDKELANLSSTTGIYKVRIDDISKTRDYESGQCMGPLYRLKLAILDTLKPVRYLRANVRDSSRLNVLTDELGLSVFVTSQLGVMSELRLQVGQEYCVALDYNHVGCSASDHPNGFNYIGIQKSTMGYRFIIPLSDAHRGPLEMFQATVEKPIYEGTLNDYISSLRRTLSSLQVE